MKFYLSKSCLPKLENCLKVLAHVFHLISIQQPILTSFLVLYLYWPSDKMVEKNALDEKCQA